MSLSLIEKRRQPLFLLGWDDYGIKGEEVGRGSYGGVYEYEKDGKRYAIKVISFYDSKFDINFTTLSEIAITITLNHPNIINVIDIIPVQGSFDRLSTVNRKIGMVMPMADYSLQFYIDKVLDYSNITSDVDMKIKKISYQILKGIEYYMSHDIIHNDIKSGNILIFNEGFNQLVKIIDFGLSSFLTCARSNDPIEPEFLFAKMYRPPEMFLGGRSSKKSDVWALGVTLYKLFTGSYFIDEIEDIDILEEMVVQFGGFEENWPGVVDTENYEEYEEILQGVRLSSPKLEQLPELQRNLLEQMLQIDPDQRRTPNELLDDPYFDDIRDEIEEEVYNTVSSGYSQPLTCEDNLDRNSIIIEQPSEIRTLIKKHNFSHYRLFQSRVPYVKIDQILLGFRIYMRETNTSNTDYRYSDLSSLNSIYIANSLLGEEKVYIKDIKRWSSTQLEDVIFNLDYLIGRQEIDFIISTEVDYIYLWRNLYSDRVIIFADAMAVSVYMTDLVYGIIPKMMAMSIILSACMYYDEEFKNIGENFEEIEILATDIISTVLQDDNMGEVFTSFPEIGVSLRDLRVKFSQ